MLISRNIFKVITCFQVWDDQGKTSTDVVAVTVRDNPEKLNVIQAIFNEDLSALTKSRLDTIIQALGLILSSTGKYQVVVIDLFAQPDSRKS